MFNRKLLVGTTALLGLITANASFAGEPVFSGNQISARSGAGLSNVTLAVSGPDGYYAQQFSKTGAPSLALAANGSLPDGLYTWEITGATSQMVKSTKSSFDNGRGENARLMVNKPNTQSGTFRVQNGSITMPNEMIEGSSIDGAAAILGGQ